MVGQIDNTDFKDCFRPFVAGKSNGSGSNDKLGGSFIEKGS